MRVLSGGPRRATLTHEDACETLLQSREPSIRWKVRTRVLGEDPSSRRIRNLQREIRGSPRVRTLLARRDSRGFLRRGEDPYTKWQGPHWVLATLADIGYPAGDRSLGPMRDQVLDRWLADTYRLEYDAPSAAVAYRKGGVPRMRGRYRRCASQQGNALYSITTLGIANARTTDLVQRLLHWQWPDGGWNCDRRPEADTSSFWETRHAMLGLAVHAKRTGDVPAREASRRASEVFLTRQLFLERHTGRVMNSDFVRLHYPLYYEYDVLGGLKAIAEMGLVGDSRCRKALDLLEEKELPGGGWPAERRFYRVSRALGSRTDSVDWGGTSKARMNEWVTADALAVLTAAGRL
ncbi:MAG TPA: hypothetical protein VK723_06030 [Thermoplasmata archaeon]|nr:hypothetical protein [Thermoplasmata archaeon]